MADESWRRPHESDEEWRLRWEFITAHYGRFPDIRLKCLSSCLVNVECYGCRYPEPVMKLLKELTVGLDEVARRRQQIRATVSAKRINFVPASSNENTDDATKRWPPSSAADGADKFIAFVPANSTSNESCRSNAINDHCAKQLTCSVVTASQTGEDETLTRPTSTEEIPNARSQECIFYQLGNIVKEVAGKMSSCRSDTEILQMALDKCKFNADAQFSQLQSKSVSFLCTLTINDIFVATGEASTKKGAKHAAFSKASEILQKPYLCVDDKLHLLGGTEPFKCKSSTVVEPKFDLGFKKFGLSTIPNVRRPVAQQMPAAGNTGRIIPPLLLRPPQKRCYNDWSQFVILRSATSTVDEDASAVSVLQQSTSFNKVELIFDYASVNNQYRCCVTIDGRDVARAISDTQPSAQLSAAQQALKILSQTCCTVIIKSPGDVAMDESVKRTEVSFWIFRTLWSVIALPGARSSFCSRCCTTVCRNLTIHSSIFGYS